MLLGDNRLPSRKYHNELNRLLLGKTYDDVNAAKDSAAPILGRGHRKIGHDIATDLFLAVAKNDPKAFVAAVLHDNVDRAVSRLPKDVRKRFYD